MITVELLVACGVHPTQAKVFTPHLIDVCQQFDITSAVQQSAFIAQAMHESARFTALEENLYYTKPDRIHAVWPTRFTSAEAAEPYIRNPERLANVVYANRMGNSDSPSGDGWRFRGRGLFQLTGRDNYRAAGYEDQPELVREPKDACITAGWYWTHHGCNKAIAKSGFDATTKIINGGTIGSDERRRLYTVCLSEMTKPSRVW